MLTAYLKNRIINCICFLCQCNGSIQIREIMRFSQTEKHKHRTKENFAMHTNRKTVLSNKPDATLWQQVWLGGLIIVIKHTSFCKAFDLVHTILKTRFIKSIKHMVNECK